MNTAGSKSETRHVLVVGLGASGRAVCQVLLRQGHEVIATDLNDRASLDSSIHDLQDSGCRLRLGEHRREDFVNAELIIVSPGVPLDLEELRLASERGVEIIGELEWSWRQVELPTIAISGTNGKTTTTSLVGEILKASGRRAFVGGNIGTPLSQWLLGDQEADLLVLEVSSFQLDTAPTFRPDVGVLLNISEDHLDRYSNFQAYVDSKFSLFARQTQEDVAILNSDDPECARNRCRVQSRLLTFSRGLSDAHAVCRDGLLSVQIPGKQRLQLDLRRCALQGPHNEENLMAAVLVSTVLEVPPAVIEQVLRRYRGLPHRLERVRTWRGIDFYDDSKGTNVGAVVKALENFSRPVWLLAGGRDKQGSYTPLADPIRAKVKGLLLYGEAGPRLYDELGRVVASELVGNLEDAFKRAVAQARAGDVILLSPACSSFDQYQSYAQRGDHFKRLVNELAGG
jgi:UDP-N-acetylmuramoylalanine--D-glutamate ligase